MTAPLSFQEAREGLRALRRKLDAIDHVLGLMAMLADSIRHRGEVPELEYNRETGEVALRVRVGLVPPVVSVTVQTAPEPKPSLGDLSDRIQGLDASGAAEIGAVEPSPVPLEALRVPCPCKGHDEMCPCQNRPPAPEPEAPKVLKKGEFTAEEERLLLKLHDDGMDLSVMALTLNRRGTGVAAKLRALLAKRSIPKERAAPERAPVAPPPPRPAAPPPAAGPALQPRPRLEREAEARLEAARDPAWPPERDIALLEAISRGEKVPQITRDLGLGERVLVTVDRFRALCPTPTIEEQAAMLAVLRTRVAA